MPLEAGVLLGFVLAQTFLQWVLVLIVTATFFLMGYEVPFDQLNPSRSVGLPLSAAANSWSASAATALLALYSCSQRLTRTCISSHMSTMARGLNTSFFFCSIPMALENDQSSSIHDKIPICESNSDLLSTYDGNHEQFPSFC